VLQEGKNEGKCKGKEKQIHRSIEGLVTQEDGFQILSNKKLFLSGKVIMFLRSLLLLFLAA